MMCETGVTYMANDTFYDQLRAAEIARKNEPPRTTCHCCDAAVGGQHLEDCIYHCVSERLNTVDGKESPWGLVG